MGLFVAGALTMFAKSALTAVVGPFVEEAREAAVGAAQETFRNKLIGRMSIEEWANIVIEGVDKVKDRAVNEEGLRFIGGKLKFAASINASDHITISFELFFLDESEKWRKAEADNAIPISKFTLDSLEEIKSKGEIVYEVE